MEASQMVNPVYKIAHSSDTAVAMFESWADRKRNKPHVDIAHFRRRVEAKLGNRFRRPDFDKVLSDLSHIGAGRMKLSPKGYPKYFLLRVSLKHLGKAGLEQFYTETLPEFASKIPAREARAKAEKIARRVAATAPPTRITTAPTITDRVVIPMSPTRIVRLELPQDLTAGEVGLITAALATLRRSDRRSS